MNKFVDKYRALPVQVRASMWFLICSFMQNGISVVSTPIFTRLLSTVEYGQYSVFNSWLGIITVFVSLNLCYGVYAQGLVKFDEEKSVFSSSLQGLSFTLTVGWTIIYLIFHNFWNELFSLNTVQMLAMLVMIWATAAFGFWSSEQRVAFKYRRLVIITLIVSIAKPGLGIILVLSADDKVTARILGLALVELIGYVGLFLNQIYRGKKFYSNKFWKYAIGFNIPLIPHYLANTVLNSADRIMIGKMIGSGEAGIYNLAYSISLIMTLFNTALRQTLEPWMYKKIKDEKDEDIKSVAYPALIGVAVVNILLIAFAPEAIAIFAPESYYAAIFVIPPIAMSVYFMFAYGFFAVYEFYFERTSYVAKATMAGAVLNVALNYIFIKQFGYFAAGYTTLLCYILYAFCHYYYMTKICIENKNGFRPFDAKILFLITIVFMAIGFTFLLTYQDDLILYLFIAIILLIILLKRNQIYYYCKSILNIKEKR